MRIAVPISVNSAHSAFFFVIFSLKNSPNTTDSTTQPPVMIGYCTDGSICTMLKSTSTSAMPLTMP